MAQIDFDSVFVAVTGHKPFPWQRKLYHDWFAQGKFPPSCNLPTGLGKTSVVAIWFIALANHPDRVPRRLVYVVNRRTVVDQTTDEVEMLRKRLPECPELHERIETLAISTLRGQFADNREWAVDPSRPAVICGTVDMIGSRLLFSGYGCGFKSKPLHAGFLGQDVLLVHDEAHLEPAFQALLIAIENEQRRCSDFRKFHVVELSATSRGHGEVFTLTPDDERNKVVQQRIGAKKVIALHELDDEKKLPDRVADLALKHRDSKRAILVFVRTVEGVEKVAERLRKATPSVKTLTGTLRGKERDDLVETHVFRRFLPKAVPDDETVFLVCTSAGEVGINISADHLVCDLSTFESMMQRFGRVNRFGEHDDTQIDVVYPSKFDENDDLDVRRSRTLTLFRSLNGDGSPKALGDLDPAARAAAFSPQPTILLTSDILFDAWALTTIRDNLPGRPPVEEFLHGVSEWEPPQTAVAWREEVGVITGDLLERYKPEDLLDDYPIKPHELLQVRTFGKGSVTEHLESIVARDAHSQANKHLYAWVIDARGTVEVHLLSKLGVKDKQKKPVVGLAGRTVILPVQAGGLNGGLLDGGSETANDVADEWLDERDDYRRKRIWDDDQPPPKMRRVRSAIDTKPDADEDETEEESASRRLWHWYVRPSSADDDGSKSANKAVKWDVHTKDVTGHSVRIAKALGLSDDLQTALSLAAKCHDLGKRRIVWQRSIGNPEPANWLAKSGGKMTPHELNDYRHEFGSLLDTQGDSEFMKQSAEIQDLVLHLIAVHHGYGRPHFPAERAFDLEPLGRDEAAVTREVPRRFARLQRKYGRWGLAYIESLLRAADIAASINPSEVVS